MASSQGFEERVRSACLEAIRYRQSVHGDVLAAEVLQEPVTIEGEPIAVFALQRGIHKPRQLDGALALTTTPPKHRVDAPYADRFGSDGMFKEVDGPMLLHGLQGFHGLQLGVIPRRRHERPSTDFLERRWEQFLSA